MCLFKLPLFLGSVSRRGFWHTETVGSQSNEWPRELRQLVSSLNNSFNAQTSVTMAGMPHHQTTKRDNKSRVFGKLLRGNRSVGFLHIG